MLGGDFKTIDEIKKTFPDEESCIGHLEKLRWNGMIISPFDPNSKVYSCKQKRYRCSSTGKYFNVKTNTLFHNSKIELQKWFVAIWLITNENKIITSVALSKELNITQKSAWFMIRHIHNYFEIEKKHVNRKKKKITEIEVVVEKDKLRLVEWLQLLKR